jgi:hypothetical protein
MAMATDMATVTVMGITTAIATITAIGPTTTIPGIGTITGPGLRSAFITISSKPCSRSR